mgnify:CR=1 FL=1
MGIPAARSATYQDILDAPPHLVAEIVDGELSLSPRPAPPHALAASGLGADLTIPFQRGRGGPGGWWILDEPELHLGADVLVPDVAGWRRERLPRMPDTAYFAVTPDWVCEVLSPASRRVDLVLKARIYAEAGVPWLWLVDPLARLVEVRRLAGGQWVIEQLVDGAEPVRLPPFEAVALLPSDWFLPEDPALPG